MENKDYFMGLGIAKAGVLLGLLIIATIITLAFLGGCTGLALTCEDQSRQKLSTCNTDCGEGLLSEFCKTKCTQENKDRLDACPKLILS